MKCLTDDHLAFLKPYRFDQVLFESWRSAVRDKTLSIANNKVHSKLLAPEPDQIRRLPKQNTEERSELERLGRDAIANNQFGVVVLNGGMATRFGGVVKGVVDVVHNKSFIGLKMQDILRMQEACGGKIQVYMMNSFATDEATREHFATHDNFGLDADQITHFTQFISVRMTEEGDLLLDEDGAISPYGPGHGDFAPALRASGCLKQFLDGGGEYLFLTNVDNLGARVSPAILGHHIQHKAEVSVEVAPKWPGDVGGSPYLCDGKLQLVEQIRYPDDFDPDIVDVFNTNTFHFNAQSLDRDFELGWYYVEKKAGEQKAVQVERLVGEMTRFLKSNFIRVKRTGSRTRFFPIKTPEDLESGLEEIRELYPR